MVYFLEVSMVPTRARRRIIIKDLNKKDDDCKKEEEEKQEAAETEPEVCSELDTLHSKLLLKEAELAELKATTAAREERYKARIAHLESIIRKVQKVLGICQARLDME